MFCSILGYFNAKISISSANCLNPLTSMSLGSCLIKLAPTSFVNCFSSHLMCPCQWRYSNGRVPRRAIAIGLVIGVYYALKDKLGAAGKFKVIDRLLMQMKEEGIVFKESLFLFYFIFLIGITFPFAYKYNGRASLPMIDIYKIYKLKSCMLV